MPGCDHGDHLAGADVSVVPAGVTLEGGHAEDSAVGAPELAGFVLSLWSEADPAGLVTVTPD